MLHSIAKKQPVTAARRTKKAVVQISSDEETEQADDPQYFKEGMQVDFA